MLSVPVFNTRGEQTGDVAVDPALLGGRIRPRLLKQAVVAFLDHQRHFSARTKGRSQTAGSTRKLYRQKGTGNARAGTIRTCVRRGGGRAFAKLVPCAHKDIPKKMRRLARNNAVLSRIQSNDVVILDDFSCTAPKTSAFVTVMSALGVDRGCLFAMHAPDDNVWRSGRNVANTDIRVVDELHAYDVLRRPKVVFTKPAFERLIRGPQGGPSTNG